MYEAGFLKHRVTVCNRGDAVKTDRGYKQGEYVDGNTYWANVTFNKGVQAMREGAVDSYDQVMIRMRYNGEVQDASHFKYNGKEYQQIKPAIILKQEDEIQCICQEILK